MRVEATATDEDSALARRARKWRIVTYVVAVLAALAVLVTCVDSLRVCRGGLTLVALPVNWESLPAGPLEPFRLSGTQIEDAPGYPIRTYDDAWIFEPAMCSAPRSGVEANPTYDEKSLRLRHDAASDTFVVTGVHPDTDGHIIDERSPLIAFRRSRAPNLAFTSGRARVLGLALMVALAAAMTLAAAARRAARIGTPKALGRTTIYAVLSLMLTFITVAAVVIGVLVLYFVDAMDAMSTYH